MIFEYDRDESERGVMGDERSQRLKACLNVRPDLEERRS